VVLELAGLSDAYDGQPSRINHADLNEDRSLIPINAFARDLISLELNDDHHRHFDLTVGRLNPRQHPVHHDVVGGRWVPTAGSDPSSKLVPSHLPQ